MFTIDSSDASTNFNVWNADSTTQIKSKEVREIHINGEWHRIYSNLELPYETVNSMLDYAEWVVTNDEEWIVPNIHEKFPEAPIRTKKIYIHEDPMSKV